MNREQNGGKEPGRHISMELTAESARVTRLSLNGNRLVVTIEAELADSKVNAAEEAAAAARSETQHRPYPRKDTELVRRAPTSPAAAPDGSNAAPDAPSGPVMGSENLPPASAAYTPGSGPSPDAFATVLDPIVYPPPVSQGSVPAESSSPNLHDTQPILGFGTAADIHDNTETDVNPELVPPAPPLEPVRELTETWDEPGQPVVHESLTPVAGPYDEQDLKETHSDEGIHETEQARPWTDTVPAPAPAAGEEQSGPVIGLAPSMDDEGLAITEESSAIGGDRHGEPQPAISFGTDSTPPAPQPQPQPAPSPSRPIDFAPTPGPAATPAPAPAPGPVPQPQADQQPQPGKEPAKPEAGSTTVLIRYTCPKCKTQGMQAVDKVGTVVNCSNCGKAMRLVMKK